MINQKRLKELLQYNPDTGIFIRRVARSGHRAGERVGHQTKSGYRQIKIDGKLYKEHRIAWLYVKGLLPKNHIDHINGILSDNRICNLRDVTRSVNLQNQRHAHKNNKSGFLGIMRNGKGFQAVLQINGRKTFLGTYKTAELAHAVYLKAKRNLHEGCTI